MTPYVVLFAILVFYGIYEISRKPIMAVPKGMVNNYRSKNFYLIIPVIVILIMGIFRETTVGYDSETYYKYYWICIDDFSWPYLFTHFSIDNGFYIVLKLIAIFTRDWWLARAILFVITFLLYYYFITEYSPYPIMSLIIVLGLALLGLMFSILRQALAGAITLFAYKYVHRNKGINSIIFILLAATIHKSALVCLYIILLYKLKLKKFFGFKLLLYSVIVGIIFTIVVPIIIKLYADSRYEGIAAHNGGYGMLLFMITVTILILLLFEITNKKQDLEMGFIFNISCGAIFLQIGALIWELLNRITIYFSFYWCLLIPMLIYKLPKNWRIAYYIIVVVLFGFMFFYQISEVDKFILHQFY